MKKILINKNIKILVLTSDMKLLIILFEVSVGVNGGLKHNSSNDQVLEKIIHWFYVISIPSLSLAEFLLL